MDTYQAIYDAVRSKISGGDIGDAVRDVCYERIDFGRYADIICQEMVIAAQAHATPSAVMRPSIFADGDMWCALYGANIHEGVCGFGKTPSEASAQFDVSWLTRSTPDAARKGGA